MIRLVSLALAAVLSAPVTARSGDLGDPPPRGPEAVLAQLKAGNARFVAGRSTRSNGSVARRRELTNGRRPKAVLVGCPDSRVPPEAVFDERLGDLFVVRLSGDVPDAVTLGGVAYAAEHLGIPVVVVLGHDARRVAADLTARSGALARLVEEGKLKIVVAVYDLEQGTVDFE